MEEEFSQVFEEHTDALFRHASFRLPQRERALELTQETFMKAWDVARKGEQIRNWRAFLFRILNNLIIDEYRKKKSTSLDALLEEEGVTEGSFDDLTEGSLDEEMARVDTALEAVTVQRALVQLPDAYKQVVVLRYMNGLSPKEIAQTLKESENVVSVRIHRGIGKLKKILQET